MNTPLLIALTFLLFVTRYILFRKKRQRLETLVDKIPGPKAYPLVGNAHLAVGTPRDLLRKGNEIMKMGSPFRVWLFAKPIVVIYDPENFQIVAHKTLQKAHGYKFFEELLGQGLITANGEKWKRNRRMLNPTFNPHLLNRYFVSVFNEQNAKLIKRLQAHENTGEHFDLWPYILQGFLNTISTTSMNYQDDEEAGLFQYGESIIKTSLLVTQRLYKPWLHVNLVYEIYKLVTGYNKIFHFVRTLPLKIINKKKEEFRIRREKLGEDSETECDGRFVKSFMELVLKSGNSDRFSDKQLADEIITLITAGSETSSITVCLTLVMLAMNQDVQEKVYDELYTVFGDDDRPPEVEDLKRLDYLEQCIKETLRRFPPVPFVLREAYEDIELKDGRIIPPGTSIVLGIHQMHNSRDVYDDPRRWNPARFSPEEIDKRHPASFAGFSIGPRSCIAAKYALLSLKTQLSSILRHYHFSTDYKMSDIKFTFDMMMRSVSGYKVRIKRREKEVHSSAC